MTEHESGGGPLDAPANVDTPMSDKVTTRGRLGTDRLRAFLRRSTEQNSNDIDLIKQYKSRTRIFGRNIRTIDIPARYETKIEDPASLPAKEEETIDSSEVPVLFAPGMFETFKHNKGLFRLLSQDGHRVVSFVHMRYGGEIGQAYEIVTEQVRSRLTKSLEQGEIDEDEMRKRLGGMNERWQKLQALPEEGLPKATLRRALTLISLVEQKKNEKFDVVDHSFGGIDAVIAAYLCPDKFRSIVSIQTGGMNGEDTPRELVHRTMGENRKTLVPFSDMPSEQQNQPEQPRQQNEDELREIEQLARDRISPFGANVTPLTYTLANPFRMTDELGAARVQIQDYLQEVRQMGIGVALIHGDEDGMFPLESIAGKKGVGGTAKADEYQMFEYRDASGALKVDRSKDILVEKSGNVDGSLSIKGGHNSIYFEPRIIHAASYLLTKLAQKSERNDQQAA